MSLVPMNLSFVDRSIQKTYSRLALLLPSTSGTVPPPQPPQLSDRPPHRDGLNVADRANDLEVHRVKLACRFRLLNFRSRRTRTLTGRGERMRASGPVQRVVRQPLGPAGGDQNRRRCRRTPVQSLGANAWHSDALRRQRSPASPWRASRASSASPGGPR